MIKPYQRLLFSWGRYMIDLIVRKWWKEKEGGIN